MHHELDPFRFNLGLRPIAITLGTKADLSAFREVAAEFEAFEVVERDVRLPARHAAVREAMRRLKTDLPAGLGAEVFDYMIESARLQRAPEFLRDEKIRRYIGRIRERVIALNWRLLEKAEAVRDEISANEVALHSKWNCPYQPTTLRKSFEKTCSDLRAMLEGNSIQLYNGAPPASDLGGWFPDGL